ncbi:GFA family protein [Massilia sp. B-10]|nr:GFA family protein [Massilia sp. B-10]
MAWVTVARGQFQLLSGQPTQFRSSNHATRSFCPVCGTQLTFADDGLPGEIDITICSLDDPGLAPPRRHIHTQSQVPWLQFSDGLPVFSGSSA